MDRKMNPLKLFDAGAGLISSAVKSTANLIKQGPSVADRIASMVKKDDEDENAFRIDNTRVVISTTRAADVESSLYRISVVDRRNNAEIVNCERKWSDMEPVIHFIRSLYPKLEVPAAPARAASRASAVVVEERRKYAQAFINVCVAHSAASKLKELHSMIGLGGPAQSHAASSPQSSNASFSSPPSSATLKAPPQQHPQSTAADDSQVVRQVTFAPPVQAPLPNQAPATSAAPVASVPPELAAVQDDRTLVDECFKVVDVDNSGYVTMDELQDFVRTLPRHVSSRAVQQCVEEVDSDKTGAFDAKSYRTFMTRLSAVTRVAVIDMWRGFRRVKLQQLYEAVTDPEAAAQHEIERKELKPLLAVLQTGGLRQLARSTVDAVEYQLPYAFAEFEDVMDHLFRIIPPHELLKALRKSGVHSNDQGGAALAVINKYAAKASGSLVRVIKDLVGRYGGTSCSNCAAVQAKHDAAEQLAKQLRSDKEQLQMQITALTNQLQASQTVARDAAAQISQRDKRVEELGATIAKMKADIAAAAQEQDRLKTMVAEAQADLILERQKAKEDAACPPGYEYATDSDDDDDDEGARAKNEPSSSKRVGNDAVIPVPRVNMYFLMPQQLGSTDTAPVVDQPGALVYDLAPASETGVAAGGGSQSARYQPMGFASDIFVADTKVHEYLTLRSGSASGSRRSIAVAIEGGCVSCPWAARSQAIPTQRWVRLSVRLHWEMSVFDVFVDGKPLQDMQAIPFRDGPLAPDAAVLDIFPRDVVAVYYANMHFFK